MEQKIFNGVVLTDIWCRW